MPESVDSGQKGTVMRAFSSRSMQATLQAAVAGVDLELPFAVQAQPVGAHELRAGIFSNGVRSIDVLLTLGVPTSAQAQRILTR